MRIVFGDKVLYEKNVNKNMKIKNVRKFYFGCDLCGSISANKLIVWFFDSKRGVCQICGKVFCEDCGKGILGDNYKDMCNDCLKKSRKIDYKNIYKYY